MREILFRGKLLFSCEWVEGTGLVLEGRNTLLTFKAQYRGVECATVYTETVGQFTGLTDKNGTKIFEGDIIRAKIEGGNHNGFTWQNMPVDFQQGAFCLNDRNGYVFCVLGAFAPTVTLEVIGNIHDNPELLKGGDS